MLQNHQLFFETLEHAQLLDIIADSSDGIFVLSPEHRVLSWNPAMENMSGLPAGDVVGRGIDELLDVHAFNEGTQAEGGMLGETGDAVIAGRSADRTWIRYTRNPIRDRDGALKAYVVVARDVTAEMQAEQMKRDFVATVSHELRTPLTPLKGFLTTLMRGTGEDTPEARQEYYRIMLNQTNRLERLITDLLEVSRIEAGKSLAAIHAMELSAVIGRAGARSSRSPSPTARSASALPKSPVIVSGDPFRVGQVVANLVSNALEVLAPRGARVDVSLSVTGHRGRDLGARSRRGRAGGRAAPGLRAVPPRRGRPHAHDRRHRPGPLHRPAPGRVDGRTHLAPLGARRRVDLLLLAAAGGRHSADDVAMALEESRGAARSPPLGLSSPASTRSRSDCWTCFCASRRVAGRLRRSRCSAVPAPSTTV